MLGILEQHKDIVRNIGIPLPVIIAPKMTQSLENLFEKTTSTYLQNLYIPLRRKASIKHTSKHMFVIGI